MWQLIYDSSLAAAFRSTAPLYAGLLAAHVVLVALLAGSSVTLVLLPQRGATGSHAGPPRLWVAAAAAAVAAGLLPFATNPFGYVDNPVFLAKLPIVAVSIATTWAALRRGPGALGAWLRALVIVLWVASLGAGRLIAFF